MSELSDLIFELNQSPTVQTPLQAILEGAKKMAEGVPSLSLYPADGSCWLAVIGRQDSG